MLLQGTMPMPRKTNNRFLFINYALSRGAGEINTYLISNSEYAFIIDFRRMII